MNVPYSTAPPQTVFSVFCLPLSRCIDIFRHVKYDKFIDFFKEYEILTEYKGNNMLIEYINNSMKKAVYDKLEDGSFSGKIPQCPGVIAFGETLYQCEQELKSSLEGWLIVKIRHGDKLPVIGRINLNEKMPAFTGEAVSVHG